MAPTRSQHRRPWIELTVLREKDGHTKTSLAKASGIALGYLCDLENGRREPNPRIVKLLAVTLDVPVSMLRKRPESTEEAARGPGSG